MKREILILALLLVTMRSAVPVQESLDAKTSVVIMHSDEQSPETLEGLLDTDLFPQVQPEVRELPWYLVAVKKPASFLLLTCCDWWDRMYKGARRMIGLQPNTAHE